MPCPVCRVDHGGPCPKLPKPPTSLKLMELTGWVPEKPKPTAEEDLKRALSQPAMMAPNLREFLVKVFRDPNLMGGDHESLPGLNKTNFEKVLAKNPPRSAQVYALYSDNEGGPGEAPTRKMAKQFFLAVWTTGGRHPLLAKGYLQYEEVTLQDMAKACQSPDFNPADKYLDDFLYFKLEGQPVIRLYLNVKFTAIPTMLSQICVYIEKNGRHGVTSFKAACPAAAPTRADSIVVYCESQRAAESLGKHLSQFASYFNPSTPGLTTRLDPKLGIATGAEPKWQATGMEKAPKGYPESAQSFGGIRSQLIAMAILNFNANKGLYGSSFEMFCRFVCVAFRSYGLDPMKPGN